MNVVPADRRAGAPAWTRPGGRSRPCRARLSGATTAASLTWPGWRTPPVRARSANATLKRATTARTARTARPARSPQSTTHLSTWASRYGTLFFGFETAVDVPFQRIDSLESCTFTFVCVVPSWEICIWNNYEIGNTLELPSSFLFQCLFP